MSESDPIWRALATGDEACPDGQALSKLGALLRAETHVQATSDFSQRVLAACAEAGDEDALIDEYYDGNQRSTVGAVDPGLDKLRRLARRGAQVPDPVDLLPDVMDNLHRHSARHEQSELDRVTRLRIWATVIVGHVAAIITIVVLHGQVFNPQELITEQQYALLPNTQERLLIEQTKERIDIEQLDRETSEAMAAGLPLRWSQIRGEPDVLFLLRQNNKLKELYRRYYGNDACKATLQAGLAWLRDQQQGDGSFLGAAFTGSADGSRALATQSLALLALMSDGIAAGEQEQIVRRGVSYLQRWLDEDGQFVFDQRDLASSDVAVGMASLALVEAALLLADDELVLQAELVINRNLPAQRHMTAGLDGYFLLALETANVGNITVNSQDLSAIRGRARSGSNAADMGHTGLMALTRYLYGYRDSKRLREQLDRMVETLPQLDQHQRCDPLQWFFPTLAIREAGGEEWKQWNTAMQRALLPCFHYNNISQQAWVPHQRVRYADNDVLATSLVLLNLQADHRYIPLARSH